MWVILAKSVLRKEVILLAVTPISAQSTSATTLQSQEQQLLSQIKNLQGKDADDNAAQIKVLQQKYNALLLQQQQTPAAIPQPQQKAPEVPGGPSVSPAAAKGIDIKA